MNKQERKLEYSTARLLLNARFTFKDSSPVHRTEQKQQDKVWRIAYDHINKQMHPSIGVAVFHTKHQTTYKLAQNRWAARHNSTAFNRKGGN